MSANQLARPKTYIDNPFKDELFETSHSSFDTGFHSLPEWLGDVLTGAARSQGNTRISPRMLIQILSTYDQISTDEIKRFLDMKRFALEGRVITSDSYLREIRKACNCAISAIQHQLDSGKSWFDFHYLNGLFE